MNVLAAGLDVTAKIGLLCGGMGIIWVGLAVTYYRKDGWIVSENGFAPPPRAARLAESATAIAALATGISALLIGIKIGVFFPSPYQSPPPLFDSAAIVLVGAAVAFLIAALSLLFGGICWRFIGERTSGDADA